MISDNLLKKAIDKFKALIRVKGKREIDFYRSLPSLSVAISTAAMALKEDGRQSNHQRQGEETLDLARQALLLREAEIAQAQSFDKLHQLVERVVTPLGSFGEMYSYDTALRIGASRGILPSNVYLHAGTRKGAEMLGFDGRKRIIVWGTLPQQLRDELEPYEVEDFLCHLKKLIEGEEETSH